MSQIRPSNLRASQSKYNAKKTKCYEITHYFIKFDLFVRRDELNMIKRKHRQVCLRVNKLITILLL